MSFKRQTPKLKPLKDSEEMPRDFWNYHVNSHTGKPPAINKYYVNGKKNLAYQKTKAC